MATTEHRPMITRMVIETTLWLAAMGAILLVAAGGWCWPQGWVFRFELGLSSFAVGFWLLRQSHVRPVSKAECPGRLCLRIKLAILFAAAFLAAPVYAQQADSKLISGCVPCHGADGIAKFGEVPNLAGQNAPYLLNQLRAFHTGKRVHKEMRYMSRKMTEMEMEAIAAYFSGLPPR
jgi:cytochrome c553